MENSRNTKQKQLILDILTNSSRPMSINDIYQKVALVIPTIAKSTIYRNIDTLIKQNLIDKYFLNDNELFYQIKGTSHEHNHYVICDCCKRIFNLPLCPIHEIEHAMEKEGFTISEHYIQISGTCKDCMKNKNH
jgi:Fur family transcriptional regulator, ferric uptake regulator